MTLSADFHARVLPKVAQRAIEFLADPRAEARAYAAEHSSPDSEYPYALGCALGTIGSLLDSLGYGDHGPDRFDCEWALTHPWNDDE